MRGENIFDKIEHKLKRFVGFNDPYALGLREWDSYNAKYKATHPVMYFTFNVVIDSVEMFLYRYVTNPWSDFLYGLRNRFVTQPTVVRIQTLKKNQYQDPGTVLLHANFQILVDFVEWEVGIFDRPKWYKMLRMIPIVGYFIPTIRNAEQGLQHLDWESKLLYDTDWVKEDDPLFGTLTPQAASSIEKRDLYLWWKNTRPIRPDPMDASGLSKHYDDEREANKPLFAKQTDDEEAAWKVMHDECNRLEKMYKDEDTANLIRLINIRESMWT